jgi:stress-induced morphogen
MGKKKTPETKRIERILRDSFPDHPADYPPEAYRYNPASIRVRVVDESFRGKSRPDREAMVLPLLRKLGEDVRADITVLLLLSPDEVQQSMMNLEFEEPTPSRL